MNWDNLRFFLEVVRTGSVSGAARVLGVNHSTVSRRIRTFEGELGVRLLERLPTGYVTTPAGEEMFKAVLEVERLVEALDRRLLGRDTRLSGKVRAATPDVLTPQLAPIFAGFSNAYPGIELEIVAGNEYLNLGKREADVAIRAAGPPPQHLMGRQLAKIRLGIYGSKQYLADHGHIHELADHTWIGWDEGWGELVGSQPLMQVTRWMRENVPQARISCRVNSAAVMLEVVKAGMGIALLPSMVAGADEGLHLVEPPLFELGLGLWIVTHEDLHTTARVRAFIDFVTEALTTQE